MNDDEVNTILKPPYNHRNAYMLFYMRDSDSLDTAVAQATTTTPETPSKSLSSIGKKRAREEDDVEEDIGQPVHQVLSSSNGAGPSNPAGGKKVSGMLPRQDRPPPVLHLAKPPLARPPHNRLPDSEDEGEEVESPRFRKAKLNLGVTPNREKDRAEGKKKKKKKLPQGNIAKLSTLGPPGKQPSFGLPNLSSDHEDGELELSDLANEAVILSTPPLPPSTSPAPSKKRKLVDYSSGGDSGPTDSDGADGERRSKKSRASSSSPASSVASVLELDQRGRERGREREGGGGGAASAGLVPDPVFAQAQAPLSTPRQRQQWNESYNKPRRPQYTSQHRQERRRKSFGNPFGLAGHQAGGSASIRRRPGGI